ncbi:MAG: PilY2 family type 4a fimbrial biogenesis protein [Hahellaceae bacterium]|nr:PilY2 family type 4a fimbrial biogenesis protein [Hahellaceae bacterium]
MNILVFLRRALIALFYLVSSLAMAEGPVTFEKAGVIESINLVNKTLVIDGVELKAPETLMVSLDGRPQQFYQVMIPGAVVTVSGDGNGDGPSSVITSLFVHALRPIEE